MTHFLHTVKVHITQGDRVGKAVTVSWVTVDEPGSSTVVYWPQDSTQKDQATGQISTYKYYNYTSGYIHHCTLENLEVRFQVQLSIYASIHIFYFYTFYSCSANILIIIYVTV